MSLETKTAWTCVPQRTSSPYQLLHQKQLEVKTELNSHKN